MTPAIAGQVGQAGCVDRRPQRSARLRAANGEPAPQVPGPSEPRLSTAFKQEPASQREWLTIGEAATYTQRCTATIRHWRLAGLLPNTDEATSTVRFYLRSDLQRVLDGPRQLHGADYRGIRDLITIAGGISQPVTDP